MQPTQKAARLISNVRWTERIYMFGIQKFSVFLVSCILLKITPGQDTMYIVGRSVAQGKKAKYESCSYHIWHHFHRFKVHWFHNRWLTA
jgi:hypothetical protein